MTAYSFNTMAQAQANTTFAGNNNLFYMATQVGSDIHLFVNHGSAAADMVIYLQGVNLRGIGATDFV